MTIPMMEIELSGVWQGVQTAPSRQYKGGFCDSLVGTESGWWCYEGTPNGTGYILICTHCNRPTFFDDRVGGQYPGPTVGNPVRFLPKEIGRLYQEARATFSVNAYTPTVLALRKLLMNIAVNKGAKEGQSFQQYGDYLAQGYVSQENKGWVDHIRKKGNDANHEIPLMERLDAEDLLNSTEMLSKIVYEFPGRVNEKQTASS